MERSEPDIMQTAHALGLKLTLKGKEYVGHVPWRNDEHPSLRINPDKQRWFDNARNESGNAFELIKRKLGIGLDEARRWAIEADLMSRAEPIRKAPRQSPSTRKHLKKKKPSAFWATVEIAEAAFEKLPTVEGVPEAARMLKSDYAITAETAPDDWRVLKHPWKRVKLGIVYRSEFPGQSVSFKWRSIARNGDGKREVAFLHGGAGAHLWAVNLGEALLVIVAGEEKGLVAALADFEVVSLSCGEKTPSEAILKAIIARKPTRIVIAHDHDETGRAANQETADALVKLGVGHEQIGIVQWAEDAAEGFDLTDLHKSEGLEAVSAIINEAPSMPRPEGIGVLLCDVQPEKVRWLWNGFIPRGKLSLIEGDPGLCKSTMTLDIAARVSRGWKMPDGSSGVDPGGVVLLSAEDGIADTIRPRLEAAGADLRRILAIDSVPDGDEKRPLVLPGDLDWIRLEIGRVGAVLVVVDPLMAFLGGEYDSHKDQDVRRALHQISTFADETGVAVLVVRHLRKSSSVKAVYSGGGSIGISGAARSVLRVDNDPDDDNRRILASVKVNLAQRPESVLYSVEQASNEAPRIVWLGSSPVTADDLNAASMNVRDRSAEEDAEEFLRVELAGGPVDSTVIDESARAAGISDSTLKRARKTLGVKARKQGMGGGWACELPPDSDGTA